MSDWTPPELRRIDDREAGIHFAARDGLAPLAWSENGSAGGLTLNLTGTLAGTPTSHGIFPVAVTVMDALGQSSPVTPETLRISQARIPPTFTATGRFAATGTMTTARSAPTATLLSNGSVLVAGGAVGNTSISGPELYDPAAGTFIATGSMTVARAGHTAMRLQDGTVLVVGGPATAELYRPASGTFAVVGTPLPPAFRYALSLRSDGSVLVTGAMQIENLGTYRSFFRGCAPNPGTRQFYVGIPGVQWFAPESEGFTVAGIELSSRDGGQTATTLSDGRILVVGGTQHYVSNSGICTSPVQFTTILSSAELVK